MRMGETAGASIRSIAASLMAGQSNGMEVLFVGRRERCGRAGRVNVRVWNEEEQSVWLTKGDEGMVSKGKWYHCSRETSQHGWC
jgi:hypothetical protein